ncbi:MAG TPA: hypothetical protein VG499_11805, partial [Actinomycetota bacterium]|nr:hypothetical protein [Actinomycetota bacterium]
MDQLPGQLGDQAGLGLGDPLGQLVGRVGQAGLGGGRPQPRIRAVPRRAQTSTSAGSRWLANRGRRPASPASTARSRSWVRASRPIAAASRSHESITASWSTHASTSSRRPPTLAHG